MKKQFLELALQVEKGEVSEKELSLKILELFDIVKSEKHNTLNDFIIDSIRISEDKRKLPFAIIAPNTCEFYPEIKMKFENFGSSLLGDKLEKMIVTY